MCGALHAQAASLTSTWLGGTGAWTDAAQWSAGVPQNTATNSYVAAIDGGNPTASSVTLDTAATIDSLQVDADDALTISSTGALTIDGASVANAGRITLQAGSSLQTGASATQLSGGGIVELQGGTLQATGLTNLDNRIQGYGEVIGGAGSPDFIDSAAMEANVSGQTLTLASGIRIKGGVVRASNGGSLQFSTSGDNIIMSGAVAEAADGSSIGMADTTDSTNSVFLALNHSQITVSGNHTGTRFSSDATSTIAIGSSFDHGSLSDVVLDGNISALSASVSGTLTNFGTVSGGGLYPLAPTTIVNHGEIDAIVELYDPTDSASPVTLTGGGRFTIDNVDPFPTSPLTNVDNQVQARGPIHLVGNGGSFEAMPGTLTLMGSGLTHTGLLKAPSGSTIEMDEGATGSGAWLADVGRIHVAADVETTGNVEVLHGGMLAVDGTMSANDLVVDGTSSLDVQGMLKVAGNLAFDGENGGRWLLGPSSVVALTRGGGAPIGDWSGWQSVEAAGRDLGSVAGGFSNDNFYFPEVVVGADGRVLLRDRLDNGNRAPGGPEAVYVDTLVFSDALGLLDVNGIHLYYNHLVGSAARIFDIAVPEPGELWLVAVGGVILVLRRLS